MAKQHVNDDHQWWPRIKDWLSILLVIVTVILVGWIFVLEASIEKSLGVAKRRQR